MTAPAVGLVYATRFGSTRRLAEELAAGLEAGGCAPTLLDAAGDPPAPTDAPLVLLTAVIWDRPLPAMRRWLTAHAEEIAGRTAAAGVVCGSAGVREGGGLGYARRLAQRAGTPTAEPFALSGEIPDRSAVPGWQWWLLKGFSRMMRKPELFAIRADAAGARAAGTRLAAAVAALSEKS